MAVSTTTEVLTMTRCLVNGELREAPGSFPVINPSTGEVFAVAPHADAGMVDDAVEAAEAAFPAWAATPIEERRAMMTKALDILQAHEAELAELLVKEQGKPLAMAIGECGMCWDQMRKTLDTELPVEVYSEDADFKTVAVRKPIGPVACITPWNFPMFTAIQKWCPSITWGNTVVHKPSPYTPLTGQRVAELIADVFPKGVFNFVAGADKEGHNVGTHLVNSKQIRKVSFTGSVNTGKAIMAASANDVKRVTLELGGNDPAIIRGDVDVAQVAPEGEYSPHALVLPLRRLRAPLVLPHADWMRCHHPSSLLCSVFWGLLQHGADLLRNQAHVRPRVHLR
jgi:acyl-CoA reductase-like NAD-dependent aldehyde dehydrogenase